MNNTKREVIRCWQCKEQFSRPLPQQQVRQWTTTCPYCGAECTVDLQPIAPTKSIFRQSHQ